MKKIFFVAVAGVIIIGALWVGLRNEEQVVVKDSRDEIPALTSVFTSSVYGLSFEYPNLYYRNEQDVSTAQRKQYLMTFIEDSEENKDLFSEDAPPREGPPSITINMFQNDIDKLSAEDFVKNNAQSNYKLGNGEITQVTKGILNGVEYTWSGLYEGRSFVVSNSRFIYMFSVTWMTPEDRIITDFENLISSVVLE